MINNTIFKIIIPLETNDIKLSRFHEWTPCNEELGRMKCYLQEDVEDIISQHKRVVKYKIYNNINDMVEIDNSNKINPNLFLGLELLLWYKNQTYKFRIEAIEYYEFKFNISFIIFSLKSLDNKKETIEKINTILNSCSLYLYKDRINHPSIDDVKIENKNIKIENFIPLIHVVIDSLFCREKRNSISLLTKSIFVLTELTLNSNNSEFKNEIHQEKGFFYKLSKSFVNTMENDEIKYDSYISGTIAFRGSNRLVNVKSFQQKLPNPEISKFILLVVLYQREVLKKFSKKASQVFEITKKQTAIKAILKEFRMFTAEYWFESFCEDEKYNLAYKEHREKLGVKDLYTLIREGIDDIMSLGEIESSDRISSINTHFTFIVFVLTLFQVSGITFKVQVERIYMQFFSCINSSDMKLAIAYLFFVFAPIYFIWFIIPMAVKRKGIVYAHSIKDWVKNKLKIY